MRTRLNGKPMQPLRPLDLSQAAMGFGIHPTVSTEDRLELMRFISDELRIGNPVLISVARGETDGYLSLGDSSWDVMAALPILANLGVSHTINWDNTDLAQKLCFACGSEELVSRVRPLLENVSAVA
ncbi:MULTISPECIES: hypothetical protein [unclassified Neorhizobium]|uniref:hypothetical protein n=1 Tax=unclassified Neorhizobium TaxID=2629175 RepID=UPI001FF16DDD|nr:hypothetical protein [Neorhizobium sp. SHOUNA12A]MCJ9674103.1 hypothetical protein [Neorhizobium sp. SHOUNA12B]MCJ9746275.1 hypothetical protein [Neorhizobium sp. SHOUNA12A]